MPPEPVDMTCITLGVSGRGDTKWRRVPVRAAHALDAVVRHGM